MPLKRIIDALEVGGGVATLRVYLPPALLNKKHHLLHEVMGYGLPPKSLFGNGMQDGTNSIIERKLKMPNFDVVGIVGSQEIIL